MIDWDKATYEALQEDAPRSVAILTDQQERRLESLESENSHLKESLDEVRAMMQFEDRGWKLIGGLSSGERLEGLDLSELKDISETIRPHLVGDGLVKRGADLHSGYVWSKGLQIEGAEPTGRRGRPSKIVGFFENQINQDSIFSPMAWEELQKARYSDGNVLLLCDTDSQTVRRIPLNQIMEIRVNPDFPEEIWAYRREWNPDDTPDAKMRNLWYYTNRYPGIRKTQFSVNGVVTKVAKGQTIVDRRFNRQIGYPLGIPDAVAAMPYIAAYTEIIQYGRIVNESLAKMLYKVVNNTKAGATATGVKIAGMNGFGNTASMVQGQDVQAIGTAGKGYDFVSARPVGAMAAAALNVPNMELLSDSSAAGSSYGAAQSLSPATKNAMRLMQAEWVRMFQEVFKVFGLGAPRVWFESLDDVDPYRAAQALTLLAITLEDEEYRGKALDCLDIAGDPTKIPEILKTRTTAAQTAASPDQGVANGTGGGGQGANDQRSDGIGEALRRMQDESFLDRFENLVTRAEVIGLG